ncbi:MAG: alpha/beta hydrolase [Clostridiales bacterium]|jgi:pimeloyl-ACP methyl ester carboxylesterase|nr:alpha/beta hydrolase [Clostridiales bacterium]
MPSVYKVHRPVIGGAEQVVFTLDDDASKPVLLILHGGPGEPMAPSLDELEDLARRFVVCVWEQRGAGMSYESGKAQKLTIPLFVSDTVAVAEFLLKLFKREKLLLMGFSWGTLLGLMAAAKAPHLFSAYIGVGQLADQAASERDAYDDALAKAKAAGDAKSVRFMTMAGAPPYSGKAAMNNIRKERAVLRKYSDNPAKSPSLLKYALKVFTCPYYRLGDKLNFFRGLTSGIALFDDVMKLRLIDEVPSVSVPVYVMQGKYDMQTRPEHAKALVDKLDAPVKEFFLFDKAGHSPYGDDKEGFLKTLDSIISTLS